MTRRHKAKLWTWVNVSRPESIVALQPPKPPPLLIPCPLRHVFPQLVLPVCLAVMPRASRDVSQPASRQVPLEALGTGPLPVFSIWWCRSSQGCLTHNWSSSKCQNSPAALTKSLVLFVVCFSSPAKFVTGFRSWADGGRLEGTQDKIHHHLMTVHLYFFEWYTNISSAEGRDDGLIKASLVTQSLFGSPKKRIFPWSSRSCTFHSMAACMWNPDCSLLQDLLFISLDLWKLGI